MTQGILEGSGATAQFYVDDPMIPMRATEDEANNLVARVLLFWRILGLDLATHKAQLAREVTWIGYTIKRTTRSTPACPSRSPSWQTSGNILLRFGSKMYSHFVLFVAMQVVAITFQTYCTAGVCSWTPFGRPQHSVKARMDLKSRSQERQST